MTTTILDTFPREVPEDCWGMDIIERVDVSEHTTRAVVVIDAPDGAAAEQRAIAVIAHHYDDDLDRRMTFTADRELAPGRWRVNYDVPI